MAGLFPCTSRARFSLCSECSDKLGLLNSRTIPFNKMHFVKQKWSPNLGPAAKLEYDRSVMMTERTMTKKTRRKIDSGMKAKIALEALRERRRRLPIWRCAVETLNADDRARGRVCRVCRSTD
jgi:hypothetical protein